MNTTRKEKTYPVTLRLTRKEFMRLAEASRGGNLEQFLRTIFSKKEAA